MWNLPGYYWLTSGAAEGTTALNAFDNALLAAGIGDLNLIKVSSVLPKGARPLTGLPEVPPGTLVPTVYTAAVSDRPGEVVCACVGIGFGRNAHGMIFEHSGPGDPAEVEAVVRQMLAEAFARRGIELERVEICVSTHRVARLGCALAAVILWGGDR